MNALGLVLVVTLSASLGSVCGDTAAAPLAFVPSRYNNINSKIVCPGMKCAIFGDSRLANGSERATLEITANQYPAVESLIAAEQYASFFTSMLVRSNERFGEYMFQNCGLYKIFYEGFIYGIRPSQASGLTCTNWPSYARVGYKRELYRAIYQNAALHNCVHYQMLVRLDSSATLQAVDFPGCTGGLRPHGLHRYNVVVGGLDTVNVVMGNFTTQNTYVVPVCHEMYNSIEDARAVAAGLATDPFLTVYNSRDQVVYHTDNTK